MGALDDAGDVRRHEVPAVHFHHPQHGRQGGEGIVAHPGPRGRDAREQGGFSGVREPQQAHVGDEAEVETHPALLTLAARLRLAGRAVAVGEVGAVAAPAPAPARQDHPLARPQHLAERSAPFDLDRGGARRHRDHQVLAPGPGAVRRTPVLAALGAELGVIAEGKQRVLVGDGLEHDVAAVPAVAAVGSAARDVGLAAEAHASAPAVAALDEDLDPIDEHVRRSAGRRR